MFLVNTYSLEVDEFVGYPEDPYAILSHTWDVEEVSYKEMRNKSQRPSPLLKKGFVKIEKACEQARKDSFTHIWIDTCCIDKSSSAELTEAINSMFEWYRHAAKCYVYLSDLSPAGPHEDALMHCRWFTRGWTLQELLAPQTVEFYDEAWKYRGSKHDFADVISRFTSLSEPLLRNEIDVHSFSIADRMSWASQRTTTRVEDLAYCLLGLFDVNMALLYGEGHKSFRRLQEEIIKRNGDMSIFAWRSPDATTERFQSVLAPSPSCFSSGVSIPPLMKNLVNFSVSNQGILISDEIVIKTIRVRPDDDTPVTYTCVLELGRPWETQAVNTVLYLRKIGPRLFCRDCRDCLPNAYYHITDLIGYTETENFYVLTDLPFDIQKLHKGYRDRALHIPKLNHWSLGVVRPEALWDQTDRVFLKPGPQRHRSYETLLCAKFSRSFGGRTVRLVAVCSFPPFSFAKPWVGLFDAAANEEECDKIFGSIPANEGLSHHYFRANYPRLREVTNTVYISIGSGQAVEVTVVVAAEHETQFEFCSAWTHHLILKTELVRPRERNAYYLAAIILFLACLVYNHGIFS